MSEADADAILAQLGAETIVYTPAGGTARNVLAIVTRNPVASRTEAADLAMSEIEITVKDSPDGIPDSQVRLGTDRVTLPIRTGGVPQTMRIVGYGSERDGVMISYEVA